MTSNTYGLVTPARNEAEHLPRLAESVFAQTVRPDAWIIVDDGSTDETAAVAGELAAVHEWIRAIGLERRNDADEAGRRTGRDVIAFQTGVAALEPLPDVIVKLDADVSFAPDFFERLLNAFREDDRLAIASGTGFEREGDEWVERHVTGTHVWGAARGFRAACLPDVFPLEPRLGWDGIDLLRAQVAGWRTRTLRDAPFRHHRSEGAREATSVRRWHAQGWSAWYMGYRPSYLLARALHRSRRDPAALALVWGYARSALAREPRYPEAEVRRALREQQRLRFLPLRVREARGLRE